MRIRMIRAAAVAAAVAIVAAGCGGGSGAGSASVGGAAAVVPADTVAFVAVDSDLSSAQWQAANALLAKLPGHDALLKQLEQQSKLSWSADVQPALGPELDLAVLPGAQRQLVGLTQPADAAKLDALLAKLGTAAGKTILTAQVSGWTAFSDSRAALDAVSHSAAHLADSNTYREATAKLAGDALVRAYVNGTVSPQAAWGAADAVATADGLRIDAYARTTSAATDAEQPYSSALVDEIPSGALLVADFQAPSGSQTLPSKLPQKLRAVLEQLRPALGGETALYVSPGLPPSVTLVTKPADPQAAHAAIDQAFAGAGISLLKPPFPYAVVGGRLVVSTSTFGIQAYRAAGAKLSADATFQEAQHASSMPQQTTGFLYANLKDALPLVEALGPAAGITVPSGLDALRTLTAFGSRTGDQASATVFLEIR